MIVNSPTVKRYGNDAWAAVFAIIGFPLILVILMVGAFLFWAIYLLFVNLHIPSMTSLADWHINNWSRVETVLSVLLG